MTAATPYRGNWRLGGDLGATRVKRDRAKHGPGADECTFVARVRATNSATSGGACATPNRASGGVSETNLESSNRGRPSDAQATATHTRSPRLSATDPQTNPAPPAQDATSRRRFLRLAGAGGAASLTALLAACGGSSTSGSSSSTTQSTAAAAGGSDGTSGDVDVLNYALTLEYLEAGFYAKVVDSGLLKGTEQELAKRFGAAEQAHVETIRSTITKLGGRPVAEPKAKFPLDDRMSVLKLAATVENLGAAAYLGQAGNISSPDVLSAALSIHSVEARHAAALNNLLGRKVTPDGAFAKPATKQDVLKAVQPFLVS